MSVRRATVADIADVVRIGRAFLEAGIYRHVPLDEAAFAAFVRNVIEGPGAIFLTDDGFCGGLLSPAYFNPSHVIAAELFWWAPTEGRALQAAFEEWAVAAGAAAITFTGMHDDNIKAVTRLYRMTGYRPVEIAFMKELT